MEIKIFYSWQSDLPNNTNRGFIEKALQNAVKSIRNDKSIKIEPRVDRDTQNIIGSPAIPETILQKIDEAEIFVCDVSIINDKSKFRLTPNPNVLFELGYALKGLTWDKVIMICNQSFGNINKLPFDLPTRRIIPYSVSDKTVDKSIERKKLEGMLENQIRLILERDDFQTVITQEATVLELAVNSMENNEPKRNLMVKRFMEWLIDEIDKINDVFVKEENSEEALVQAINESERLVINFATIVKIISDMNAVDAAHIIYGKFSNILERYNFRPKQNLISFKDTDFDFYKFIGHELFVVFTSSFIHNNQWLIIKELLRERFYVPNIQNHTVSIGFIPQSLKTFVRKKERLRLNRFSLHADELAKRYREGELGKSVSFNQFMEADLFLFLFSEFNNPRTLGSYWWIPHSGVYFKQQIPQFLIESERIDKAKIIGEALGVPSLAEYREKLDKAKGELKDIFSYSVEIEPLRFFNAANIGIIN